MSLDNFRNTNPDELTQDDVADEIEEWTGVKPVTRSNGPRFFARYSGGEPEHGILFTLVLPGPRVYVDPTVKNHVSGQVPTEVREHPEFEETKSLNGSF